MIGSTKLYVILILAVLEISNIECHPHKCHTANCLDHPHVRLLKHLAKSHGRHHVNHASVNNHETESRDDLPQDDALVDDGNIPTTETDAGATDGIENKPIEQLLNVNASTDPNASGVNVDVKADPRTSTNDVKPDPGTKANVEVVEEINAGFARLFASLVNTQNPINEVANVESQNRCNKLPPGYATGSSVHNSYTLNGTNTINNNFLAYVPNTGCHQ